MHKVNMCFYLVKKKNVSSFSVSVSKGMIMKLCLEFTLE